MSSFGPGASLVERADPERLALWCHFAAERHAIWQRRIDGSAGPWTSDPVLESFRFTNAFRAVDRVSQFLIAHVTEPTDSVRDLVLRTALFRFFNRSDTWQFVIDTFGTLSVDSFDPDAVIDALSSRRSQNHRIYSNAYIVPPVPGWGPTKDVGHVHLAHELATGPIGAAIARADSLAAAYDALIAVPGLGRFLAFQLAVDLGYSPLTQFDEAGFVIAGPGAIDGISKIAPALRRADAETFLLDLCERLPEVFGAHDLEPPTLDGRPLQPIDVQNLFCEISKYTRVAAPTWTGVAGRTRIKARYAPDPAPLPPLVLPSKWRRGSAGAPAAAKLLL